MGFFSAIAKSRLLSRRLPEGKPGARAYAVGDIHGRLDLLDELLGAIEDDISAAPVGEVFLVFLGDLIDRGPDSAGVVQRLLDYRHPGVRSVFLGGNHEEVLLNVLEGAPGVVEDWLRFGGAECVRSYGVDVAALKRLDESKAAILLRDAIPPSHVKFVAEMGDTFRFGDYLLVHAGIRPGVPLDEQTRRDLRWIREPFLSDECNHDMIVVHGHTVTDQVDERENRIGIDTGAVYTGRLTALVLEGSTRRYIVTEAKSGAKSSMDAEPASAGVQPYPLARKRGFGQ